MEGWFGAAHHQSVLADVLKTPIGLVRQIAIVDDAPHLRAWVRGILGEHPQLNVLVETNHAEAAQALLAAGRPDAVLVVLDDVPQRSLKLLRQLLNRNLTPLVLFVGSGREHCRATIAALSKGAVDCIFCPVDPRDPIVKQDIGHRLWIAAKSHFHRSERSAPPNMPKRHTRDGYTCPLILMGASTGGVTALERVLTDLHPQGPAALIVQHMPAAYLSSFVQMLDRQLPQDVALATENSPLENGQIRFAPSNGLHSEICRIKGKWTCRFSNAREADLHCPSVDRLFASAAVYHSDMIAVILTGLGRDGANGMHQVHLAGGTTIGQDEASSVVYGMPRAAWDLGAVGRQVPLRNVGYAVNLAVAQHNENQGRM